MRYGVVTLLCLIFSAAGLVLGIMAKLEEDKFYLFAWIGIVLNALTLLGIGDCGSRSVWIMTVMEERFELASQRILKSKRKRMPEQFQRYLQKTRTIWASCLKNTNG